MRTVGPGKCICLASVALLFALAPLPRGAAQAGGGHQRLRPGAPGLRQPGHGGEPGGGGDADRARGPAKRRQRRRRRGHGRLRARRDPAAGRQSRRRRLHGDLRRRQRRDRRDRLSRDVGGRRIPRHVPRRAGRGGFGEVALQRPRGRRPRHGRGHGAGARAVRHDQPRRGDGAGHRARRRRHHGYLPILRSRSRAPPSDCSAGRPRAQDVLQGGRRALRCRARPWCRRTSPRA